MANNWFADWHGTAKVPAANLTGAVGGGSTATSTSVTLALSTKASLGHGHPQSDVTGLTSTLSAISLSVSTKAAGAHTHVTSEITGLDSSLAGLASAISTKAAGSHTHPQSDITNLTVALSSKASLNNGVVPASQLPALSAAVSSVTLAFGYPPKGTKLFTITDATVNAASHITLCSKAVPETFDNAADSEVIVYACVPAAGSFQVYARGLDSPIGGNVFTVYQVIG